MKRFSSEAGFTMVEMMAVLVIIAVLVAGGAKFYAGYIEGSKVTKAKAQIALMQAAMDTWYAEKGVYPAKGSIKLTDLTGTELLKAGIKPTSPDKKYVLDPWGQHYEFTIASDGSTYTITTNNKEKVEATGTAGESEAPRQI